MVKVLTDPDLATVVIAMNAYLTGIGKTATGGSLIQNGSLWVLMVTYN